jgi:hypothetical protein
MSVYEIENLKERFDLILFLGVLYHLRHPLLALETTLEKIMPISTSRPVVASSPSVVPSRIATVLWPAAIFLDLLVGFPAVEIGG